MITTLRIHLADYWLWFLQWQEASVKRSLRRAHLSRARLLGRLS